MAGHVIKILGKGCGNCAWTERLVREVATASGLALDIVEVTDTATMIGYGVMSTPAVVIDERVVHAGGIPKKAEVQRWIDALR